MKILISTEQVQGKFWQTKSLDKLKKVNSDMADKDSSDIEEQRSYVTPGKSERNKWKK